MTAEDTAQRQASGVMFPIPRTIKRNTILLAISLAFLGAGMQMVPTLGPLQVVELLGTVSLAGVGSSIVGLTRFAISYPMGAIMDAYGRRSGLLLGLGLSVIGAVLTGLSSISQSFPLFLLGMCVFGLGIGGGQQLRVAAADMYPPTRRAEGVGYVLTGSLLGAVGGPVIIAVAQSSAHVFGLNPLAFSWLLVPFVVIPSMVLVFLVRPDPKEIASNLELYYPGYRRSDADAIPPAARRQVSLVKFLRHYPKLVAFVASFAVQGNMGMMMAMTSITLDHYGHGLSAISLSVAIHVIGMFGLSLPLGKLTDSIGRRKILAWGVLVAGGGSLLVPLTSSFWFITAGTFLVGVGWSCVNVAATAVIADTTDAFERGRAIGTNDTFGSGSAVIMPLIAGPMAAIFGLLSVGILGLALMVAPFVLCLRLAEPSPGRYLTGGSSTSY